MKFKAAMRMLQSQFALKKEKYIVAISKQEQKAMDEMRAILQQTCDLQSLFDQEIDKIIKMANTRKQTLYKQVQS